MNQKNDVLDVEDNFLSDAHSLGKCWAALRGERVVMVISMKIPSDVDFDVFRDKSLGMLNLLGDVKTGELLEKDGDSYFLARPHKHQNRSKKTPNAIIKPLRLTTMREERNG